MSLGAFGVMSLAVGLAVGALPPRLATRGRMPNGASLRLGLAAGFIAAAVMVLAGWFRTPLWSKFPDLLPLGGYMPWLGAALEPATAFVVRTAVLVTALVWIDRLTAGWTRHRAIAFGLLSVVGMLGVDAPAGLAIGGWLAAVALTAIALPVLSVWLLRADLTMIPITLAVMAIAETLARAAGRAYPGAFAGGVAGALLIALLAWWLFRTLRSVVGSAERPPPP